MRTKRNSLKKGTKWLPIFPIGIPILYNFKLFFFSVLTKQVQFINGPCII